MRGKQALIGAIAIVVVVLGFSIFRLFSTPTFDMPKALAAIAANEGVWDNPWTRNGAKVHDLRIRLAAEPNLGKRYQIRQEIGTRLLVGGEVEAAIKELRQLLDDTAGSASPAQVDAWKADLALAYFRLGEVQNCIGGHNSASCIFPIDPKAVHLHQTGAAEAIKIWTELLSAPWADPENALADRWMLNVAYMVLGQYPDKVPRQWLIEPKAFESEYDIGRFEDVAPLRGVKKFGLSGGAIMDDFDNDGHFDLMVSSQGIQDQIEYFHNDGHGQFTNWTDKAGLKGITGGLYIVQADYDNDGYLDVFIPRGAWLHERGKWPPSLLHNNRDGTFTDVTAKAGLLSYYPTQTAAWADFDGDGFLDLFVGNEIAIRGTTQVDPFLGRVHQADWPADAKNFELYHNNRDGTFTDIGVRSGIELHGMIKGATWCDYDNDGRPDLYVTMRYNPNHLFKNMGPGPDGITQFKDVTRQAGVAEPAAGSFATWCWDYNNDGWEDILVLANSGDLPNQVREYLGQGTAAVGERPRLYRNNGDGTFTDVTKEAHLDHVLSAMGSNFGDLDNDGWLDFYVGTGSPALNMLVPNRMFRNADGKFFQDVTTSGGFGILQKGHAVAFGDVDHSGNQDVLANIGGAYESDKFWSVLFKNPGHPGNHWIKLKPTGVRANRGAVGARIKVSLTNRDGSLRDIYRTVTSGGSFGANPLQPHIGLGPAERINQIEIRWPGSGLIQKFDGPIALDRLYSVKEGDPIFRQ